MPSVRHLLSAFVGGELDPLMMGRVETDQYAYGLATCENFVAVNEGALVKRPGFEFIRDADPTSTWLSAFRFSVTQEYVLEWGTNKLRFFTNGLRIETAPNVAYEVVTTYAAADAPAISTQQSYDRLYLDHASYAPRRLTRTSATTFALDVAPLVNGPFADGNTVTATTVQASAVTGAGITLTASAAIFLAGHVGALFRLEAKDFANLKVWEPGVTGVLVNDIVRSDGKVYQAATAGTTGTVQPTHTSGTEWDGQLRNTLSPAVGPYGVQWAYLHDKYGTATITAIGGGGTTATATVVKRLPDQVVTVPSWRWAHAAFSAAAGWPSLVAAWKGRLLHVKGFEILASVAGDYLDHAALTDAGLVTADQAFRRRLANADPPLWLAVDRKSLVLGTATNEIAVGALNQAAALSGDNIDADPQSYYGSEPVFPVQVGTETVFVERGGRRVRSADYDYTRDRYTPVDLTAASRHITKSGVVQLAYQRVPYALIHAVRSDGQIAVHPVTKLELKGFMRTVLGGAARVVSAVSVVGADGMADELWVLVSRATPAGTRREIWKQASWRDLGDDPADAFFVDAGITVAMAGGVLVSPVVTAHLANQAVAVLVDGAVVPGLTVDGAGVLTLPRAPATPFTLTYGLPFTARAVTLRPELRTQKGTIQGAIQRMRKLMLRLAETVGIKIGTTGRYGDSHPEEPVLRPGSAPMDAAIPLFTGDTQGSIDSGFENNGQAYFQSSDPLPAMVLMARLSLETDDDDA